ncbi:MAG TPA: class I SAM-dependent methyltransferase [Flavipsychrobacter sp.]|nr:class I SAM-dependent methyltransferase [Flavipsychrobacter sp.]
MNNQFETLTENYDSKTSTYYYNPRLEMLSFIPKDAKRLLDIGCSTGGFGANLKKVTSTIEIWGIEPYSSAASEASKQLDKVINGIFEKDMPELEGQKFDVIVFNDVLEHLVNPEKVLKDCHQYLNEGGVVVASIPNIMYFPLFVKQLLLKEDWEYMKEGVFDNTHLRFFTKKSMLRLFKDSGYTVQHIQGINAYQSTLFSILNFFFLNKFKNWRYQQYVVVSKLP